MSYDAFAAEYDAAFAWESHADVIMPVWRALGRPQRVIEFACGPARLLGTLVANGVLGIGVDVSKPMLALAQGHLEAAGGRYAVQLSLKPLVRTAPRAPDPTTGWEFELDGERLRYLWYGTGVDPVAGQEIQRSRIEWLSGARTGEIVEQEHRMAIWDYERWRRLVDQGGFRQIAALDIRDGCRELEVGPGLEAHAQVWHVLEAVGAGDGHWRSGAGRYTQPQPK